MKMMWGCMALVALAIVLAATGVKVAFTALFVIPCMLMMAAMMWMMIGGMRGGFHDGHRK